MGDNINRLWVIITMIIKSTAMVLITAGSVPEMSLIIKWRGSKRENKLIQDYNNQGINKNYPQHGTNFWGRPADDNYGFGNSDIEGNVENVIKQLNNPTNDLWQKVKDVATIATDTIRYMPESLGELAADAKIAYDYWQQMNKAGDNLVKSYGPNQGADIDNYYHPLLQCQLAKISPTSRDWGLRLGYAEEYWITIKRKELCRCQKFCG